MIAKYLPVVFLNDKDLYDALMSSRKKIKNEVLVDLMKKRGILLSEKEDREHLIDYISSMNHAYSDIDYITDFLQSANRTEKLKSFTVPTNAAVKELRDSFETLKRDRNQRDEIYTIQSQTADKLTVKVEYNELDFSKTTLKQRRQREALIEIERNDNEVMVRTSANERMTEITNHFMRNLEVIKSQELVPKEIDLSGIASPEYRTRFFLNLIKALNGFKHDTVTFIDVHSEIFSTDFEDDEYADDEEEKKAAAQELLCYVKRASMDGFGLLQSSEYQHLTDRGFFISNIVWHAIEDKQKGLKIEFQALLNNPKNGHDFRYLVRGAFNPNRTGEGYNKTKRAINEEEKSIYIKVLEDASKRAFDLTLQEYFTAISKEEVECQNETD